MKKQFELASYYDHKLRGIEDTIKLNWGDDPDLEEWIWGKAAQGNYVVVKDVVNGYVKTYRPVEHYDQFLEDLEI